MQKKLSTAYLRGMVYTGSWLSLQSHTQRSTGSMLGAEIRKCAAIIYLSVVSCGSPPNIFMSHNVFEQPVVINTVLL